MSTARMAPLWRSLALRPRSAAAAAAPAAFVKSAPASAWSTRQSNLQRAVALPGAARGYADDASRQPSSSSSSSQADASSFSSSSTPRTTSQPEQSPSESSLAAAAAAAAAAAQSESAAAAVAGRPSEDENQAALQQLAALSQGLAPFDANEHGHNFGLSTASTRAAILPEDAEPQAFPVAPKLQERYDPVIHQVTRLMMRDGKLAKAQRDMATVLNFLRQSPPPNLNPARPLLRGHLPASQLPLDPAYYLALAIDSVAPLFKIRNVAGAAGGGRALPVPTPLALRQRRRTAFMWLLDSVKNKQSRGSGRGMFATRVAEEVVAIAEGRSNLWEKRQLVHKLATTARMNAGLTGKKKAFVVKVI